MISELGFSSHDEEEIIVINVQLVDVIKCIKK